jgi:uncharacterized membrane protein
MHRTIESLLRFVNLTASGLLAGSLGFGDAALVPGWQQEVPRESAGNVETPVAKYFDAIGPLALASAVALAVASRGNGAFRRTMDAASAVGLAGVLGTTIMVTVPINRELEAEPARDYASDRSRSLVRSWSRAHAVRTTLGVSAFICAVASNLASRRR